MPSNPCELRDREVIEVVQQEHRTVVLSGGGPPARCLNVESISEAMLSG